MSDKIEVVSVNISEQKGTVKYPVDFIEIDLQGIVNDAHAGPWHRQISLLSTESIQRFVEQTGRETRPGEFAENITVRGIDLRKASLLDRFQIGDVELELTQIGKKCHGDSCAIFREVGECVMPKEGIFCRVLHGGTARAGNEVTYLPKKWRFRVITLSDRAHRGEYPDRSGPKIGEWIDRLAELKEWNTEVRSVILPDDAARLRTELDSALKDGVDVIITSGGTGVGPRDITPDVVTEFCNKIIPGIMDAIRLKFGQEKPNALISRSVAGVAGRTLVYALPGSVKAVNEYMPEIIKSLEHLFFMLYELDVH